MTDQPVDSVEWVDPETLYANGYNPNRVAPVEMRLLATSILEDGWTQPIVARTDGEIVDGFHRWTIATRNAEVRSMTGGLVPVVRLSDDVSREQQVMSTVRHNRARGVHGVEAMASIVADLIERGLTPEEVGERMGMDSEEVRRLSFTGSLALAQAGDGLGNSWVPGYASDVVDEG